MKINKDYTNYAYAGNGNNNNGDCIFVEVPVELGANVENIIKKGVRQWLIIADPGIGYSKPLSGNLEVLREAVKIVEYVQIGDGKMLFNIKYIPGSDT